MKWKIFSVKIFLFKSKAVELDVIIKNVYFPSLVVSYFKRTNESKWSAWEGIQHHNESNPPAKEWSNKMIEDHKCSCWSNSKSDVLFSPLLHLLLIELTTSRSSLLEFSYFDHLTTFFRSRLDAVKALEVKVQWLPPWFYIKSLILVSPLVSVVGAL